LPIELAKLGHQVFGISLSYRARRREVVTDSTDNPNLFVLWHSVNLGRLVLPGLVAYVRQVYELARRYQPHILWACSDSLHVIIGITVARALKIPCVVDLYDNFESFKATQLPGILTLFKRAVRDANGVTCVSRLLAEHITRDYHRQESTLVLENAVRRDLFYARERVTCRNHFGFPEHGTIIGTAGALHKSRGIEVLFRAFDSLSQTQPGLHLAIAGARDRLGGIAKRLAIYDMGMLPLEEVPFFLSALDVAVICNKSSLFGRYCFPQKAYEILACRVPLVAAAVGSMNELLIDYPQCLYEPESAASLGDAIRRQLEGQTIVDVDVPSWADSAKKLESFFEGILESNSTARHSNSHRFIV
jgi:glycosyltransferase involved in cell wall biosynthesis